jgi:hypothetical protein
MNHNFKECTLCKTVWSTRFEFLYDPQIRLIGYQMNVKNVERGLLLFNHLSCRNTLALDVIDLSTMYDGPFYRENKHGSQECPAYCLNQDSFEPCPVQCACAYIREIMKIIQDIDHTKKTNIAS